MTDLDPESRRILEIARDARTPSAEDKARVERRFAVALGLSATAASAGAATAAHAANGATAAKSVASATALKWWAGAVLVAGAVASYATFATPAAPAKPAQRGVNAIAAAPATSAAPATTAAPVQPNPAPAAAPAEMRPASEPAAAPDTTATPEVAALPARAAQYTAHRVEHRRPATPADTLASELELLHRAQSAWRAREAQAALALLHEHRTRYPHSQLRLEREALEVLTLCELGRKDEAAQTARSVLERAPRTPLRASLEQSCAFK